MGSAIAAGPVLPTAGQRAVVLLQSLALALPGWVRWTPAASQVLHWSCHCIPRPGQSSNLVTWRKWRGGEATRRARDTTTASSALCLQHLLLSISEVRVHASPPPLFSSLDALAGVELTQSSQLTELLSSRPWQLLPRRKQPHLPAVIHCRKLLLHCGIAAPLQ